MPIQAGVCNSFKRQVLNKEHDLDSDNLRLALYTDAANLDPDTDTYTASGEASGTGYTAGGPSLSGARIQNEDNGSFITFDNPSWSSAAFTASGALLYNASNGNKAICVLDFGGVYSVNNATFTIRIPSDGLLKLG